LKHSKEKIDDQIKEACIGILKEKDDEINKLQDQLRKDIDKELKAEKEALKKALESVNKDGATDQGIQILKKDIEQQFAQKSKKWEEKRKKYHKEIEELRRKLKEKEDSVQNNVQPTVSAQNTDNILCEERRKAEKMSTKYQQDHDKLKDELTGQISRIRAEYDEKIGDYEKRLEKALGEKVDKMLELREEVEEEYADKMDELRVMYRDEMNVQVDTAEKEKARMHGLESSLQESLKTKREELEDVRGKYEEAKGQIEDLTRRLNNQTEEVLRLTEELENYDYEDAES